MRDILFRAKRIDDNKWVYGYFFHELINDNLKMEVTGNIYENSKDGEKL